MKLLPTPSTLPNTGSKRNIFNPLRSVAFVLALIAPAVALVPPTAAEESVFIDTNNRAAVEAAYHLLAESAVPSGWNGNIDTCDAGTLSQGYIDQTVRNLNLYRALAGVSPVVEDPALTPKAQQAALMIAANGELNHTPPPDWDCYTEDGYEGSYNSNLGGFAGPNSPGGFVDDYNYPNVGHRLVSLYPNAPIVGVGSIPETTSRTRTSGALWVDDGIPSGYQPEEPERLPMRQPERLSAWPTEGYFVNTMVPVQWSMLSDGDINLYEATVEMTVDGAPITVETDYLTAGGGSNNATAADVFSPSLVWRPNFDVGRYEEKTVTTTITHSTGTITYTTYMIAMEEEPELTPWDDLQLVYYARTVDEIVRSYDYDVNQHGEILRLYRAFFNREADVDGAKYWLLEVAPFHDNQTIAGFFAQSDEFNNNYSGVTDAEYLTRVYANILGRGYDQGGYDYWLDLLQGTNHTGNNPDLAQLDRAGVVFYVALSPEFTNQYPYKPS